HIAFSPDLTFFAVAEYPNKDEDKHASIKLCNLLTGQELACTAWLARAGGPLALPLLRTVAADPAERGLVRNAAVKAVGKGIGSGRGGERQGANGGRAVGFAGS